MAENIAPGKSARHNFQKLVNFHLENNKPGWWFQIFVIFTPKIGEDSHFDEHIFQMGWFNRQLANPCLKKWRFLNQPTGKMVLGLPGSLQKKHPTPLKLFSRT